MFKVKPESTEYEIKTIRLPVSLIKDVQDLADKNSMSFNKVVTQCIQYALEHQDSVDQ